MSMHDLTFKVVDCKNFESVSIWTQKYFSIKEQCHMSDIFWVDNLRGSFNKFYLLLQNFVNIKASHMKCVTFVAPSLSYTFMVNPIWYHIYFYPYTVKAELIFWTT